MTGKSVLLIGALVFVLGGLFWGISILNHCDCINCSCDQTEVVCNCSTGKCTCCDCADCDSKPCNGKCREN